MQNDSTELETENRQGPRRQVFRAEALDWMENHPSRPQTSVITSLPDISELPEHDLEGWRIWFVRAAERVVTWVPDDGVAIFFQSDIRRQGVWIDKGYLVLRAAENAGAVLLWHKIVCRKPPGTITHGRASYSHLLCVSRTAPRALRHPGPDVLADGGTQIWSRAMGVAACRLACRFLREETATHLVCDPFCGRGTALAVANDFGFDAVGVDRSERCCRAARSLTFGLPDH